jgi:hypothetical protein
VEDHNEIVLDANASGTRMRCWMHMNPNRKLLLVSLRHPQNVSVDVACDRTANAAEEGLDRIINLHCRNCNQWQLAFYLNEPQGRRSYPAPGWAIPGLVLGKNLRPRTSDFVAAPS